MDQPTPERRIANEAIRIQQAADKIDETIAAVRDASPEALTKIAARLETARLTITSAGDDLLALVAASQEG